MLLVLCEGDDARLAHSQCRASLLRLDGSKDETEVRQRVCKRHRSALDVEPRGGGCGRARGAERVARAAKPVRVTSKGVGRRCM